MIVTTVVETIVVRATVVRAIVVRTTVVRTTVVKTTVISTTDLITMTSIPVYSGSKTVKPALSYQTIILNQWVGTYVVLTEQEETNCLLHRCYVHGMEKSVYDHSCGIPQYLDKNLESCAYEEIYDDNKIHLIPALPDGAFFSFKFLSSRFCQFEDNIIVILST